MSRKKHPLCMWYWTRRKRWYLRHPLMWCQEFKTNVKNCYLRIRDGWCPDDVWSWDTWFVRVVPPMLRYLAEHGCAYPGTDPFDTPEKWHDWLNYLAAMIGSGDTAWQDAHNEYYNKYMDSLFDKNEDKELTKNYFTKEKELFDIGHSNVKRALFEMGEHFFKIWD